MFLTSRLFATLLAVVTTTPFRSGMDIEGRRCHTVRIPAVRTAPNGDLVAAFDARWNNINDAGTGKGEEVEIAFSRSTDGGKTWSAPKRLHDFPWTAEEKWAATDPSLIVDRTTGTIFCLYNVLDHKRQREHLRWVQSSTDNGQTWSAPRDVTAELFRPGWARDRYSFMTSGGGTQLRDGTLLAVINDFSRHEANVFGSADHGRTWRFFGNPVGVADETKIIELDDGTWMLNARSWGPQGNYRREVYLSKDRGETWMARPDNGLLDTGANGAVLKTRLPDGRTALLLSNCHSEGRKNLTLKVSFDGGATWPKTISVRPGIAAYSDMTELPDGRIGMLYEAGDKALYERFDFAVFAPSELMGEVSVENILREVRSRYETALVNDVAAWWLALSPDAEHGGFLTCLDRQGRPYDGKKQLWMQAREIWMFARLYNSRFRDAKYLAAAERGWDFLSRHAHATDGRCHYLLTRDGHPLSDSAGGFERFTESFLAIAAAELFRATGKESYAAEARRAYAAYRAATDADETTTVKLGYPMIELNTLQVMRRAFGGFEAEIDAAIRRVRRFARAEDGLFFESAPAAGGFDTATQDGRFAIPGHALEGLSFMMNRLLEKPDAELRDFVLREIRVVDAFGRDPSDGAIWYCADVEGKPMARRDWFLKAWWPQAEAATAMMQAFELSGERAYLDRFLELDRFIRTELRDPLHHEYFAYAPVAGRNYLDYKGSEFKGFFHLPRYFLSVIETIDRMLEDKK